MSIRHRPTSERNWRNGATVPLRVTTKPTSVRFFPDPGENPPCDGRFLLASGSSCRGPGVALPWPCHRPAVALPHRHRLKLPGFSRLLGGPSSGQIWNWMMASVSTPSFPLSSPFSWRVWRLRNSLRIPARCSSYWSILLALMTRNTVMCYKSMIWKIRSVAVVSSELSNRPIWMV